MHVKEGNGKANAPKKQQDIVLFLEHNKKTPAAGKRTAEIDPGHWCPSLQLHTELPSSETLVVSSPHFSHKRVSEDALWSNQEHDLG